MTPTRLYVDEDAMTQSLIHALRARGADVTTAFEAGMVGRQDSQHLEFATTDGRALYSFNVAHFCQLHSECLAQGNTHAGIILAHQQRYSVGEQMRRLLRIIATLSTEEMANHLIFLSDWG